MRGFFLSLEGIDGSGKTTLAVSLEEWLKGKGCEVVRTREPGGTALGRRIRELLLDTGSELSPEAELCLYLADRAQHTEEVIIPALEAGRIVISERYADSTVAYQGHGRGLDLKLVAAMNELVSAGLRPDLTILLEAPVETGLRRRGALSPDRLEAEERSFHERVAAGYAAIAARAPERVKRVNADREEGAVLAEVKLLVEAGLGRPPEVGRAGGGR
jgi:dTMP kinase